MRAGRARDSYIVRFFRFLTQFFYQALGAGIIGRFFSSYHVSDRLFRQSGAGRLIAKAERGGGRTYYAIRRSIALAIDRSFLRRFVQRLLYALCLCSLRTVGVFFVTAGSYSVIAYGLFTFVWKLALVGPLQLYAGIASIAIGVLLLFFDTSLGFALRTGFIFSRICVPLFGFSEETFKNVPRVGKQSAYIAIPLGMLVGMLTAITSPFYVLAGLLAFFLFFAVLSVPEAGVLLLLLFIPFVGFLPNGSLWLVLVAGLPLVSYLIKLLRGNRVFQLDVQDFVVLLLLITTVLSGVSIAAFAWRNALISALMVACYFLVVNVIATPRWLKRSRVALIVSATAASLIGIVQFVQAAMHFTGSVALSSLGEGVRAGFADRTTFAYFLLIAFPFALCVFLQSKKGELLLSGFACVAIVSAIVLTWVQSAWIAVLVMIVVFALIHERRAFPFVLLFSMLTPVALAILPDRARTSFFSVMRANSGEAFAKTASAGELASRIFFGKGSGLYSAWNGFLRLMFGLGNGGFEQFCLFYVAGNPAEVASSLNFWLSRLLEGGVLGILLPALLFFLILQNCFSLLRGSTEQQKTLWPTAGVAMIVGVLIHGIFRYAWYDFSALAIFFVAVALIAAQARYERRQNETHRPEQLADSTFAQIDYYKAH